MSGLGFLMFLAVVLICIVVFCTVSTIIDVVTWVAYALLIAVFLIFSAVFWVVQKLQHCGKRVSNLWNK